ncbi:uncharacterized protein LOC110734576 [Chenopodium quinoa]|uniref:uncharacterized protein LOC110734576 n=1 Tax=Chenopodium quinoa TaxID=63459 RepID=UPI000B771E87|nr:uncharacterized protein LOC110734576 [Chenopodium quinoa]
MTSLKANCYVPCIMFGDFNEVTSNAEKEGGAHRSERLMDSLKASIDNCRLRDLDFTGSIFTWERGTSIATYVRKRLDRFLADDGWCALFPDFMVRNFPIDQSYHAPIMASQKKKNDDRPNESSFKFEPLWLSKDKCGEIVLDGWNGGNNLSISQKIGRCGEFLASWVAVEFGSTKKIEKQLRVLKQRQMDGATLERCQSLSIELNDLRRLEESYWFVRARAKRAT